MVIKRLLSRNMQERSILSWILEISTQALFFTSLWIVPFPDIVHYITNNYLGGNYVFFYRTMYQLSSTLPWIFAGGFYFTLYYIQHPFFEKYRIQEWVWNRKDEKRKEQYFTLLRKTVGKLIQNSFVVAIIVGWLLFPFFFSTDRDWQVYVDNMPSCWENFWKIMVALFMFDTGFYWSHRLFHEREWVKKIFGPGVNLYQYHKDHHAYYVPTALAGAWLDDWDGNVTSIACGFIPAYFLDMHCITFCMYTIINITHSCYDHAGYHFPYDPCQLIPLGSHNDSHNAHHSMNTENYGLYWRHWDVLMGTDTLWVEYERNREDALHVYAQLVKDNETSGKGTYNSVNYTFAKENNTLVLYFADLTVKDGVVLVNCSRELKEISEGDDNLDFSLKKEEEKNNKKQ